MKTTEREADDMCSTFATKKRSATLGHTCSTYTWERLNQTRDSYGVSGMATQAVRLALREIKGLV